LKDGQIYSHPHKLLDKHLQGTLKIAEEIALSCGIELNEKAKNALLLHDIAKAHPTFQKMLLTGRGKFGHAEPSAVMVLNLTRDLLYTEAVRRHHSRLQNMPSEVWKFWNEWELDDNQRLFRCLPWWTGANDIALAMQLDIQSWYELLPNQDEWEDIITDVVEKTTDESGQAMQFDWLKLRSFFSILVASDRMDAAIGERLPLNKLETDFAQLKEYLQEKKDDKLAEWREGVRKGVIDHARLVLNKPSIYTLTLPTGAGKTIAGLQAASEFAQRSKASRIIYVLPYVSLVEQNADIARIFLRNVREDHHLAYGNSDTDTEKEYEQKNNEDFISFFRYWQEPVIITTLAKLWEVLFSPRANDAMSFHSLYNAVVIFDEPQAIPANSWLGLGNTLEMLSSELNTTFILMTATQPEIAKGTELAPNPVIFPAIRHKFHWLGQRITIEELVQFMVKQGALTNSSLFVLNTRKSALLMWIEIRKKGLIPYFLSRWMTPLDRNHVLQEIKTKEKNRELRCLVSTQVIEAGIDLDFELAFRDLGPMDSIIQVAGRCNRHCTKELGRMFIAELGEKGRSYATQVYDSVLLQQTRLIFQKFNEFDESLTPQIIADYYGAISSIVDNSELWGNITEGRWGEYVSLFSNYDQNEAMLIIDYDGNIDTKIELLQQPVNKGEDKLTAVKKRRQLYMELSRCSISVPKKYLDEWGNRCGAMIFSNEPDIIEQIGPEMWVVRQRGIGKIYRRDIGFVPASIWDLLFDIE